MKQIILTSVLLALSLCLFAGNPIKPLLIGDEVPNSVWDKVRRLYTSGEVEDVPLSRFKNRLIILDFWGTWCTPCVSSLSELHGIYKKFGDKILVLPVAEQSESVQIPFIQQRKWEFTFMFGRESAKELSEFFPHRTIPHQIWIQHGKVLYITDRYGATLENIEKTLQNEKVKVFEKKDGVDFNPQVPLFFRENGGDGSTIRYQSMIAGYTPGLLNRNIAIGNPGEILQTRIVYPNKTIEFLYQDAASLAFNQQYNLKSKFVIELPESLREKVTLERIERKIVTSWLEDNAITYSLIVPEGSKREKIYAYMFEDLNRYFSFYNIQGKIERRLVNTYVLQKRIRNPEISSSTALRERTDVNNGIKSFRGMTLDQIVRSWQSGFDSITQPFVNETGITGKVDLDLDITHQDLDSLNKSLKPSGLILKLKKRAIDLLVIGLIDKSITGNVKKESEVKHGN